MCLQCNIWSPSTDTCGTGTQQAARSWGLEQSSGEKRQKETEKEKKNQRIQHLNATKDFDERSLGILLWAVGGTEEDGEGPLLHVDGDKLLQSLVFPHRQHLSAGAEGRRGSLSYFAS